MEAGTGPWMDLSVYLLRRKVRFNHGFVFSHGYCPECVAQYNERLKSLREAECRLRPELVADSAIRVSY